MPHKRYALILAGDPPDNIPKLLIPLVNGSRYITVNCIAYLSGNGKLTTIALVNPYTQQKTGEVHVGYHLGYFAPLLEHRFARINQSQIVRLQYVTEVSNKAVQLSVKEHPALLLSEKWSTEFFCKMEKTA